MLKFLLSTKAKKQKNTKLLAEMIKNYQHEVEQGAKQFSEHRKQVEDKLNRGTKLTEHRINL